MHSVTATDSDIFSPYPRTVKVRSKIPSKRASWVAILSLIFLHAGCGGGHSNSDRRATPGNPGTPAANISISPTTATVGSPDLTLTVSGSKTFTFADGGVHYSTVVWIQDGLRTPLLTTFVNPSQLTAILPAAFLANSITGKVCVEIWDRIENSLVTSSDTVPFQVTSTPTIPTPAISSISPSTIAAGSPDVTLTIDGSNFGHYGHFVSSTAFWTTNGNLHDTGTWLQTAIVSSSQLTAVIPAKLLQSPTSVQIVVMNGDVMGMSDGYFGYPRSNSVSFIVTP